MLPICFLWFFDFQTVFVFPLALLFLVKVAILVHNGDFDGIWSKKKNIKKIHSYGPSANLRPLHNSNVAKVSIVKWSQILSSTAGSSISGIPRFALGPSGNLI